LPVNSNHVIGDVFSVDIRITDVIDLISYQFDLGFNQTVLLATNVLWGPFLQTGGSTITAIGTVDNAAGLIDSIAEVLSAGSVTGTGVLASVQFQVIGSGISAVTLTNPFLFDENFVGLAPTIQNATVTVTTPVPEPAILPLLASGLAGGVAQHLRKRRGEAKRRK